MEALPTRSLEKCPQTKGPFSIIHSTYSCPFFSLTDTDDLNTDILGVFNLLCGGLGDYSISPSCLAIFPALLRWRYLRPTFLSWWAGQCVAHSFRHLKGVDESPCLFSIVVEPHPDMSSMQTNCIALWQTHHGVASELAPVCFDAVSSTRSCSCCRRTTLHRWRRGRTELILILIFKFDTLTPNTNSQALPHRSWPNCCTPVSQLVFCIPHFLHRAARRLQLVESQNDREHARWHRRNLSRAPRVHPSLRRA